jgi:hypothetical protein
VFHVSPSGFVGPDGKPFVVRGLNMDVKDALPMLQGGVLQVYPGLTAIRLVCIADVDTPESIAPIVLQYTGRGIAVEAEDHGDSQNGGNTRWYTAMASYYKDNPLSG